MSADTPFLESYDGQSVDELIALEGQFRIDSIVLAFEAALDAKGADKLSSAERVVLSIEAIEREVNNGGFNQFFANSSRDFSPHVVESLNLIGCPQTAELCQKAIDLLGVDDLFDSDAIEDAACDADDDLMERFNALDEVYYAGAEEPIAVKLFEFIKRNRNEISLADMAGASIRLLGKKRCQVYLHFAAFRMPCYQLLSLRGGQTLTKQSRSCKRSLHLGYPTGHQYLPGLPSVCYECRYPFSRVV